MSETAAVTEPNLMSNVRLCDAIKWHPCLYDSKSKVYQMKHAVDAAWQSIANECEDTVANCKLRWRIIRKSYLRSFRQNVPTNRYYLTDYLDFLRPHLRTLCANEEMASNAEDFDMVHLEDVAGNSQDDDAEGEEEEEYEDEEDPDEDEHEKHDGDNDDEDAEVEEYELDEENGEKDDEDSDTASAEETLKLNRGGRRKGKGSNMTTPDVEEAADDNYQPTGAVSKQEDTARTERRLVRTRKANIRYKEYDTYDKKRHQEQKPDDKRRAGKRSFEPEISVKQEPKQDEKRLRRSIDRQRELNAAALNVYKKPKVQPKKVEVKLAKTKVMEAPPPPPPVEISVPKVDVKEKEREVYKVRTFVKIDKKLTEQTLAAKPKMTDNFTEIAVPKTRDRGTQSGTDEPTTLDDAFIESLKPQIAIMNSRQKFNFKRRVYQALMDVFDDAANFPNKNELIELPPMGAPRFDNTTSGELRLMRELVNLVTAAKSTPEIMLAKDKVATPDDDDDDDVVIETTPVSPADKPSTPTTASVHHAKRHETLGLPRHILQKVVKVAGCNGGTILAHEGDKRRVYRIYPKGTVPPSVTNNASAATSQASIGTFYVTPPRTQNAGNSSASQPSKIITSGGNTANGKQTTVTSVILRRGDNQVVSNNSPATAATASPVIKSSSAQREITVSRQRVAVRSQFPMTRRGSLTNSSAKNSPVQNKVVTSTNIPATAAAQEKPSPSNAYPVQRFSAASLEGANKKGLSQIQISQPVSLNAAAKREHNIRTFLSTGQGPQPYEDNSGENEIFPDNPKPETREDDSGQSITDMVDNTYGAANPDIKSEPID